MCTKMHDQLGGMTVQTEDRRMVHAFREIAELARSQLDPIREERERRAGDNPEEDDIGAKEYMNDFVSEEYVTKNIRVMPMAGQSIDNTSEHTSKYYASGMGAAGAVDSDIEDTKHN